MLFPPAAWLREQADYLAQPTFTRAMVVKLTGSNHTDEKARIIALFNEPQGYTIISSNIVIL